MRCRWNQRANHNEIRSVLTVQSLAILALLAACESVPPDAPPRPPPKPEMEPVLPSWSSTIWVMGFGK
ncbi:CDI system lipoprotein BcpO [Burkholderia ubonensis]|uniref:CDI system lipoprotein BcpO n=1 Tax=Burkholderia ubonensis TaxID=101571 RepID=UPI0009B425AD|nr:CDI system lipoprotein BcpO [Burkholderia ubonensis]